MIKKYSYTGSKNASGVAQRIISEMPVHTVYIELFAGTGIVGRLKKPAAADIFVDSDTAAPVFMAIPPAASPFMTALDGRSETSLYSAVRPGTTAAVDDAISVLKRISKFDCSDVLLYVDPPYLMSVRSHKKKYYRHEFHTEREHIELASLLMASGAGVMVSGYDSPLYRRLFKGWRRIEIPTIVRSGERRIEIVWMNFPPPIVLHDSRFVGDNFRERERIKRKRNRWEERLRTMSRLDRIAVVDAIRSLIAVHGVGRSTQAGSSRQK